MSILETGIRKDSLIRILDAQVDIILPDFSRSDILYLDMMFIGNSIAQAIPESSSRYPLEPVSLQLSELSRDHKQLDKQKGSDHFFGYDCRLYYLLFRTAMYRYYPEVEHDLYIRSATRPGTHPIFTLKEDIFGICSKGQRLTCDFTRDHQKVDKVSPLEFKVDSIFINDPTVMEFPLNEDQHNVYRFQRQIDLLERVTAWRRKTLPKHFDLAGLYIDSREIFRDFPELVDHEYLDPLKESNILSNILSKFL